MNVKKAKDYLDKLNKNWLGGGYIILTFGITSETTKKKKKRLQQENNSDGITKKDNAIVK